ncbi:hypothetical protein MRB53_039014 [Persea americana]|nr:hypothetical protein MRB53_039014 [Persea americana]
MHEDAACASPDLPQPLPSRRAAAVCSTAGTRILVRRELFAKSVVRRALDIVKTVAIVRNLASTLYDALIELQLLAVVISHISRPPPILPYRTRTAPSHHLVDITIASSRPACLRLQYLLPPHDSQCAARRSDRLLCMQRHNGSVKDITPRQHAAQTCLRTHLIAAHSLTTCREPCLDLPTARRCFTTFDDEKTPCSSESLIETTASHNVIPHDTRATNHFDLTTAQVPFGIV